MNNPVLRSEISLLAEIERLRDALTKPITMQDIRLQVGEGKLPPWAILDGANAVLRQRADRCR